MDEINENEADIVIIIACKEKPPFYVIRVAKGEEKVFTILGLLNVALQRYLTKVFH